MNLQRQLDKLIACQAADWFEKLQRQHHPDNAGFLTWICETPRHLEAFLAIASEDQMVRKVLNSDHFDVEALLKTVSQDHSANVQTLPVQGREPDIAASDPVPGAPRRVPFSRRSTWKWAAASTAVLAIASLMWHPFNNWQQYETQTGDQRSVQLAEGSVLDINVQTRLDVQLSHTQREIRLQEGEAIFKVTHDTARPFRVRTQAVVIEAVGTQFDVNVLPDASTSVTVLEGQVKLTTFRPGMSAQLPVALSAGEQAHVSPSGSVTLQHHADLVQATSWKDRRLIFKSSPLSVIAAEFNRYNKSIRIRLEGVKTGDIRFSGAFAADEPESLADVLRHEPGFSVDTVNGEIVIDGTGTTP